MRSVVLPILLVILLCTTFSIYAQDLENSESQLFLSFEDDDINSSKLNITLFDTSELNGSDEIYLKISNGSQYLLTNASITDIGFNLIRETNSIEIVVSTNENKYTIFNKNLADGVVQHSRHVYSNWTFGQPPPPDNRGLGQGAILDVRALNDELPQEIFSTSDGTILAEKILNLINGTKEDLNQDDTIDFLSDGYGFIQYAYGMRDHINNAGAAVNAPSEVTNKAIEIVNNFSTIVEPGDVDDYFSLLNTSNTSIAKIYQNALDILNTTEITVINEKLSNISDIVREEVIPILFKHFNEFRNLVYGVQTTFTLQTGENRNSDTSNNDFMAFIMGSIVLVSLILTRKKLNF